MVNTNRNKADDSGTVKSATIGKWCACSDLPQTPEKSARYGLAWLPIRFGSVKRFVSRRVTWQKRVLLLRQLIAMLLKHGF